MTLTLQIQQILDGKTISQREIAQQAGINAGALSAYLKGTYSGNIANVESALEKGIDSGRAILTEQMDALQNITGRLTTYRRTDRNLVMPSGAFASIRTQNGSMGSGGADDWAMEVEFNASKVVRTSTETRPRNIAYQYICLAA